MGKKSEKVDMWQLIKNVAIIFGMFSAGIGVGLIPRCDNLQTVAQAKEDHEEMKSATTSLRVEYRQDLGKLEKKADKEHVQLREEIKTNQVEIKKLLERGHKSDIRIERILGKVSQKLSEDR